MLIADFAYDGFASECNFRKHPIVNQQSAINNQKFQRL